MRRFGLSLSLLAVLLIPTTAQMAAAKGGKKGPEKVKGPAPIAKAADVAAIIKTIGKRMGEAEWPELPAFLDRRRA